MNRILSSILLFVFGSFGLHAVPAVLNYAGQVAVNGQPFDGQGLFKFALVNADGNATYWSNDGTSANGSEPAVHVGIAVNGGLYSLLLGNTAMSGMGAIDPAVFAQHGDAKLRVWFSDGVNGFQQLSPDRPFASVPYALSAGSAQSVVIADGSINKSMLGSDVIADLNATIGMNRLSSEVTTKLDQNGSGASGVVAGSLISVPHGQSAPEGYSLYQQGTQKALVWEEKSPVSVAKAAYDGVEVLDGKIYFVGGRNWVSGTNFNDTSRYNSVSNSWETLASISVPRAAVACSVLNGKLYAIGGVGLSSVEIYEPTTNTWSTGPALPSEVNHATAITVDGRIYLIGGRNSNQDINQVLCLDPSTNQWQTKANMPTARQGMKLLWFENRIWAIGGKDDGNQLNTVESYDPDTDSWRVEASLTTARAWPIAWSTNSQIYSGGGSDSTSILLDSLEAYDSTTNQWSIVGNLPENKYAADAVVLNNTVYVVAGNNGSDFSDKVYAADLSASVDGVYDLYRKDGNASAGSSIVQAEVADGSVTASKIASNAITTNELSEQILKYLKPEITAQPHAQTVYADSDVSYSVTAEGKYLSYQWKKDGSYLTGENNAILNITDANATVHDGNYSVLVSNEFGSVESNVFEFLVINPNVISLGLVGWWQLDGNTSDMSGNGNDGTITGVLFDSDRKGISGRAFSFDGDGDMINLGNNHILNPSNSMSLLVWFKINAWKRSPIIERYATSSGQRAYVLDSFNYQKRLRFRAWTTNDVECVNITSSEIKLNSFHHATVTYDSNNESCLYLDGILQNKKNVSAQIQSTTSDTTLGGYVFSNLKWFHGTIDDVRIYDRALSAAEVQALYNLGQ